MNTGEIRLLAGSLKSTEGACTAQAVFGGSGRRLVHVQYCTCMHFCTPTPCNMQFSFNAGRSKGEGGQSPRVTRPRRRSLARSQPSTELALQDFWGEIKLQVRYLVRSYCPSRMLVCRVFLTTLYSADTDHTDTEHEGCLTLHSDHTVWGACDWEWGACTVCGGQEGRAA